jgi:putative ABC transport system permease protein
VQTGHAGPVVAAAPMTNAAPPLSWHLAVALVLLLALAVGASVAGRVGIERPVLTAAGRAVIQLAVVALIIGAVLDRRWASLLFALAMFTVAVITASGRVGARHAWAWIAGALAAGVVPVLLLIFGLQAATFTGPAIVAIAGIIIGGAMTAHTLAVRRAFDTLRADRGLVEAALALGFDRQAAISVVIGRHASEAVLPAIDQTRTVGLVTLPGAFVGVLLGGGSATDAAASQLMVLVGLLATQTCVVTVSQRLIAAGRILAPDLRQSLPER